MSKGKFEQLQPGRELDALVAERVFGHKTLKIDREQALELLNNPITYSGPASQVAAVELLLEGLNLDDGSIVAPYSTDIAAAWLVIEKLKLAICWSRDINLWVCAESEYWLDTGKSSTSESAPHAICLAALRATELS